MATLHKIVPDSLLHRDGHRVTRLQDRRIRKTFPFLSLPLELRLMVYDFCIDSNIGTIPTFFDTYHKRLSKGKNPVRVLPPRFDRKGQKVFSINRQIRAEATYMLQKTTLMLNHGLFDIESIKEFVSDHVLKNIGNITISTSGHDLLQEKLRIESWDGYMFLFKELSNILAKGHKLKKLTINFDDSALVEHMTDCFDLEIPCEFREMIEKACERLSRIRGVGSVTVTGFPAHLAKKLKARIESTPKSFLELPGEIRNLIYSHSFDYSSINNAVQRTMKGWNGDGPYPQLSTPTILLLNKQVHAEASSILRSKPLNLIPSDGPTVRGQFFVPSMLSYISKPTIQRIEHLTVKLDEYEWIHSLEHLFRTLSAHHSLKSLHFDFTDRLKAKFTADPREYYPDTSLHISLSGLKHIRGVGKVTFTGDLPEVYTKPLKYIMEKPMVPLGEMDVLPPIMAVRADGEVSPVKSE